MKLSFLICDLKMAKGMKYLYAVYNYIKKVKQIINISPLPLVH